MADYRVLRADFRETLAACEGQAARTCYEGLEWEDYQALGDAVKDALIPGGHCLLNLSAPVRQLREGHGTERDPMPFRVFLDWYDRVGLTAPDTLAFGRDGLPGLFGGRFRDGWEPLFWFRKTGLPRPVFKSRLKKTGRRPRIERHVITKLSGVPGTISGSMGASRGLHPRPVQGASGLAGDSHIDA